MSHRMSALAIGVAVLGSVFVGAAALPRAASAQAYEDAGPRAVDRQTRNDEDLRPPQWRQAYGHGPRGGVDAEPGDRPQGYDDRGRAPRPPWAQGRDPARFGEADRRWPRGFDQPGYGARYGRPGDVEGDADHYGPGFPDDPDASAALGYPGGPVGPDEPYEVAEPDRMVAAPVGPPIDGKRRRYPDRGCTIRRTRTITPVGWHKTVTQETCYQRR